MSTSSSFSPYSVIAYQLFLNSSKISSYCFYSSHSNRAKKNSSLKTRFIFFSIHYCINPYKASYSLDQIIILISHITFLSIYLIYRHLYSKHNKLIHLLFFDLSSLYSPSVLPDTEVATYTSHIFQLLLSFLLPSFFFCFSLRI